MPAGSLRFFEMLRDALDSAKHSRLIKITLLKGPIIKLSFCQLHCFREKKKISLYLRFEEKALAQQGRQQVRHDVRQENWKEKSGLVTLQLFSNWEPLEEHLVCYNFVAVCFVSDLSVTDRPLIWSGLPRSSSDDLAPTAIYPHKCDSRLRPGLSEELRVQSGEMRCCRLYSVEPSESFASPTTVPARPNSLVHADLFDLIVDEFPYQIVGRPRATASTSSAD